METKKFIKGIFTDSKIANFVENDNLMDFAILNVNIDKKTGIANFDSLTNFWKLESHKLDNGGQFAFELFGMFRNPKNAIASLLKHLETKKPITEQTFKDQAKLTPKKFTEEQQKMRLFSTFWASLDAEQQKILGDLATEHFKSIGLDETGFQFFFLNGSNGITLKKGDFVRLKDSLFGYAMIGKVLQASPNGYVSLVDTADIMTLSNEASKTMQILKEEDVPKETKKIIDEVWNKQIENGETDRISQLETGAKLWNKAQENKLKAEAKAEAEKKKLEASNKEKAELEKLSLNTSDEVKAFVNKINSKESKLIPDHKKELAEKVKVVKETLKTKVENAPTSEKPKTEKKPTSNRKRKTETETPKADTIDKIIAEDAKSESPIL